MSDQTMLKVERLTKTYKAAGGPLTVLRDVSFELWQGRQRRHRRAPVAAARPRCSAFAPVSIDPRRAIVILAGESIGGMNEDERALVRNRHIGFVFQNFQLVPTLTALENVTVPVELRGEGGRAADGHAPRAARQRVGLGERYDHYPVQLSGGEQQRVALARAFMNKPKILFCDEPTGNLDGATATAMVDLIFGLNHQMKTTLVLVTHDLELAKKCHRVIRLKGGLVSQ
jgi:putative ABC transport system ATP-binding protein